jgi:hypothetical protein
MQDNRREARTIITDLRLYEVYSALRDCSRKFLCSERRLSGPMYRMRSHLQTTFLSASPITPKLKSQAVARSVVMNITISSAGFLCRTPRSRFRHGNTSSQVAKPPFVQSKANHSAPLRSAIGLYDCNVCWDVSAGRRFVTTILGPGCISTRLLESRFATSRTWYRYHQAVPLLMVPGLPLLPVPVPPGNEFR